MGELHNVGLTDYFRPIVVSGDYGYRKLGARHFHNALEGLGVVPEETLFIGNQMYRDIYGAHQAGMKTLLYDSFQGDKSYPNTAPDFTITDYRELLRILGV